MGQFKFNFFYANRAGAIKRVVRRGFLYTCGVCRSTYDHEGAALGCVVSCWHEVLALDPVILKPRPTRMTYRCRFCARDHAYRHAAKACAADCRDRFELHFEAECALVNAETVVERPRPGRRRAAMLRAIPVAKPAKWKSKQKTAASSADAPAIDLAASPEGAAASEPAVAASDPVPTPVASNDAGAEVKKPKPKKVFYRDDAKYVCTVCNEKYFTKVEVTKCYDQH